MLCGKNWIIFAVLLTITNAIKPNFILFFAPMMLIYLIADFIREKGKNVIQCIKYGSAALVSQEEWNDDKSVDYVFYSMDGSTLYM